MTYDDWKTTEPEERECVPEFDPRVECERCGVAYDPADWGECPDCRWNDVMTREHQAPISDYDRIPTSPLGHETMTQIVEERRR